MDTSFYYKYSDYLKNKYGEKVYKLPISLPITCPNRQNGKSGCTFCAETGTGFESLSEKMSVSAQLLKNKAYIGKKYHVRKFIAYFQNYTNTYMPLEQFKNYIREAALDSDIVEISISTRPDCIREDYLLFLDDFSKKTGIHIHFELGLQTVNYHTLDIVEISISTRPDCIREDYLLFLDDFSKKTGIHIHFELGLQTVNYHTLDAICRGHGLAEFIDSVLRIKKYRFTICVHMILNLPGDTLSDIKEGAHILSVLPIDVVKLHSLYIAKASAMGEAYQRGELHICSKDEYFNRLKIFLENLRSDIAVERLFSRLPEKDSLFSNWGISWWKLAKEFEDMMIASKSCQGSCFNYTNGAQL